jgi:hypothetical protein
MRVRKVLNEVLAFTVKVLFATTCGFLAGSLVRAAGGSADLATVAATITSVAIFIFT